MGVRELARSRASDLHSACCQIEDRIGNHLIRINLFMLILLLFFPGETPRVVGFRSVGIIHDQQFVTTITIFYNECEFTLSIIEEFRGAVHWSDLISQKVPSKMGFAGSIPTFTGSLIKDDLHFLSPYY
jgi:hypothetical protein